MFFLYNYDIESFVNSYCHDAFFHYLVSRHDEIRRILCQKMIINNHYPIKGLEHYIHHFAYYDQQHQVRLPYNLNEITIVQLAYLDMENIDINVFDELMYLFKYNHVYDKISIDKNIRAISMMSSKERLLALERDRMAFITRQNIQREERINAKTTLIKVVF